MSIAMFKQKVNFTISHHHIKIIMMVDILNPIAYMFVCFFFYLNYMWFSVGGGGLFSPLKKNLVFYFDDLFTRLTDLNSLYSDSPVRVECVIYLFFYP